MAAGAKAKKSRPPKSAKVSKQSSIPRPDTTLPAATPPARVHSLPYHYPLLLEDGSTSGALLEWFEGIEEARSMPWRKKWIDPAESQGQEGELEELLARRAYEVWVSEIMLQQTRVSTVIPYFKNWISKWPTIQDLAKANPDDVLSVWKGLGYYSRATRLHQGAQAMVAQNKSSCPIPSKAEELQNFPGIGRYTAGAISSIAFGEAEPVLDGNVARVLSRQLGLYVDVKDKKASDLLWEVADQVVKSVCGYPETMKSKVPGNWNQAMMELGSTICTPRPKCEECPIRKTCRAYAEGEKLSEKKQSSTVIPDIEDACSLCEQLDTEELVTAPEDEEKEEVAEKPTKKRKAEPKATNMISQYFTVTTSRSKPVKAAASNDNTEAPATNGSNKRKSPALTSAMSKRIATYCSLFPKKIPKKKVAEEEAVVCILELQLSDGSRKWLIEQRPAKGLLASLWQFPQSTLPTSNTVPSRKSLAQKFLSGLNVDGNLDMSNATHVAELDSLVHVFSHLKLTMHVQLFRLATDNDVVLLDTSSGLPARKWVDTYDMENQSLSTGMQRCWALVETRNG